MAVTAQQVIDRARYPLNDTAKSRYFDADGLSFLNDGLLAMVIFRPDLFTVVGDIACAAATCDQVLPVGGVTVLDVFAVKNGRGVTKIEVDTLRTFRSSWRSDAAGPCQHWMYLPEDIGKQNGPQFTIYPQAPNGQVLTGMYVKTPATLVLGANLPFADDYSVPLQHYVTGRFEMLDDEHVDSGRVKMLLDTFESMLKTADLSERTTP